MEVLDYEGCAAPNDVYGKMFWYLRDLLVRFQRRIAKISVKMLLTCESGRTLPDWLPTLKLDREFDRIEVCRGVSWLDLVWRLTLLPRLALSGTSTHS